MMNGLAAYQEEQLRGISLTPGGGEMLPSLASDEGKSPKRGSCNVFQSDGSWEGAERR